MNILLGLGPGDLWPRALEDTVSRAKDMDDDLTVVIFGDEERRADIEEQARERLTEAGLEEDVRHVEADRPGSRIVDLAETGEYERIVIPGGQRSPLGKIQFDDTTEFVLLNAAITVTLVR